MSSVADPTKVMGRRVVATLIDGVIILVPFSLYATSELQYLTKDDLASSHLSVTEFCDQWDATHSGGVCVAVDQLDRAYFGNIDGGPSALLLGLTLLVFVVLQGVSGWTFGKLLTGIRCVKPDGSPAGVLKALVRWILWLVDGLPFIFLPALVGFIVGLTTVGHRRVGDMVAKTYVVRKAAAGRPIRVAGLDEQGDVVVPAWTGTGEVEAPPPTAKHGPQWDEARGTYIQWDPAQTAWMQWDEEARVWQRIPGQGEDEVPPPPELPTDAPEPPDSEPAPPS
jgi:hypothetical protein